MKLIYSEFVPFAGLVFLFHQKSPGFRLRIPGKGVVKRAVRVFKDKLDAIAVTRAIAKRFGKPSAKDIDPVRNVTLAGVVIADEDHSFVTWRRGDVLHMDA